MLTIARMAELRKWGLVPLVADTTNELNPEITIALGNITSKFVTYKIHTVELVLTPCV